MGKEKKFFLTAFLIVFLFLFLFSRTDFIGPDQPVYYAYTQSLVEDGDLNVVNNIERPHHYFFPHNEMWLSSTFNLPDFHNHGAVMIWSPFYLYGKKAYSFLKNLDFLQEVPEKDFLKASLSMATALTVFITLVFIYFLSRIFFSPANSFLSLMIMFFGTPFFYFSLIQVGNANVIAALFFTLFIIFSLITLKTKNKFYFFIYGLFFSICAVVKVDLWFQIFFFIPVYLFYLIRKKTNLSCFLFFISGIIPGYLLKAINDFIKYGANYSGEFSLINFNDSYLWEQLFSSYRGFFYTSPIFYISILAGFICLFYLLKGFEKGNDIDKEQEDKFEKNLILSSLLFLVVIKIIFLGQRFAWGGGTCGARPLVSEFVVFVLLYADFLSRLKRSYVKIFVIFLSVGLVFWNMLVVSEFMAQVSMQYMLFPPSIIERIMNFAQYKSLLPGPGDFIVKFYCWFIPAVLLLLIILVLWRKFNLDNISLKNLSDNIGRKTANLLIFFSFYFFVCYSYVTFINYENNFSNVAKMANESFFYNFRILSKYECAKNENILSMNEMVNLFSLKKDFKRAEKIRKFLENYK